MPTLHIFLTGASTMGFLAAAVFFARFWRQTQERLFILFAVAFAALAVNRAMLAIAGFGRETQPYVYMVRLAAFLLIAWAVIDKNRNDRA